MTTLVDFGGNTLITENIRVGATSPGQAGTDLSSAELLRLDAVTPGTVSASKAVVVDANKDIGTFRNVTSATYGATGLVTARSGTATPAAASAVAGVAMGSAGVGIYWGTGSPNTALTAPKGSLYLCTDGSSSSTRMFVNTDSSTAWAAVTTAS